MLAIAAIPGAFAKDMVLNIAHPAVSQSWSPLQGGGHTARWNSLWWAAPAYFDKDGKLVPFVITKAASDAKFTTWTLTINPKAVFSDGSPITAEDVKGTWDLCVVPSTKHQRADLFFSNVVGYTEVSLGKATAMSGIVAKDKSTVVVTLATPDPIFNQRIASALISPVKISQARGPDGKEKQEWWSPKNKVVVSGPFMPKSMDLDQGIITFVPNPKFWGPKPKLTKIVVTSVVDASTATLMLQRGKMDVDTELITPTIITDLGADFVSGPVMTKGQHFWFIANRPPMDDINVRKALIMCINPADLAKAAFPDGPYKVADQVLNKVDGVDPNYPKYAYDPEGAKKAMAASKYKEGKNLPKIMFVGISTPTHEAAAQYIAEQWRKILGIEAVEMKPAIDTYSGPDQAGVQIFRDDVGVRVPDAVSYLMGSIHSASGNAKKNMGGYKNDKVDDLLEKASALGVNDPQRNKLAQEAQRIFRDEYMFIPYYYDISSKWAMPWVKGLDRNDDWQCIEPWNVYVDESLRPKK
jgi:peptide/nickel transport system substrate-binding protein